MSWKLKGIRKLERNLQRKLKDIDQATTEGLVDAGNHLLGLSQPLVPVDTGRLKASGAVIKNSSNQVFVSYEAHNPVNGYDYALIQHEDLAFYHADGTQAKFLEQPFRENINGLVDIIAGDIKRGVDK